MYSVVGCELGIQLGTMSDKTSIEEETDGFVNGVSVSLEASFLNPLNPPTLVLSYAAVVETSRLTSAIVDILIDLVFRYGNVGTI